MTRVQLHALVRGFVPALQAYIAASLDPLHQRVTALETQERLPGVPGPAGPAGKDGAAGRDGTLDGCSIEQVDERTWRLVRSDGSAIGGPLSFAVPLYRGVYVAATKYVKGDSVTFGGSLWIAREATEAKPGDGATAWQLAVKAGREGREGKPGKDGAPGPKGDRGDAGRDYR